MVTGSSSNAAYQGNNFARKGVIFVSFNTRESLWAYPNSAELKDGPESQNFGILDVDKALQWVRDNIAGKCFFFICLFSKILRSTSFRW
jgi:carboxylesterase type B